MRDLEHAKTLLSLAREDLQALRAMQGSEEIADRIFGFHAQQAVEKVLRGWLALLGVTYPLTHSLNLLFSLVEDRAAALPARLRDLEELTPFAVQLRYGAYGGPLDKVDPVATVGRVAELLELVEELLGEAERGK